MWFLKYIRFDRMHPFPCMCSAPMRSTYRAFQAEREYTHIECPKSMASSPPLQSLFGPIVRRWYISFPFSRAGPRGNIQYIINGGNISFFSSVISSPIHHHLLFCFLLRQSREKMVGDWAVVIEKREGTDRTK